jgi:outer membrane protein TolC
MSMSRKTFALMIAFAGLIQAQAPAPPLTLTLQDALSRAQVNNPQVLAAVGDAASAHEDLLQARAGLRPSASFRSDYLGTQGNGQISSGRFVTNDGVHVYRDWGVIHQDFTAAILNTAPKRAIEAEALASAKIEIARRGLAATVTRAYYTLLAAQRKYAAAQQALDQAQRYLELSQALERGGEVAHSDVVKADLQHSNQDQAFRESRIAMDGARLDLAVLLFRDFDQNFTIVDDLDLAPALPAFPEVQQMAGRENPDIKAANAALRGAKLDVTIARQAFLPSLTADVAYGIEANAFALHSTVAAFPEKGPLPNLGYFATISLNVPLWDWGSRSSRVRQAELKRQQADVELTAAQRELIKNLLSYYQEAQGARDLVDLLKHAADLAAESLRLNALRYQAGEIGVFELVDAQTAVTQARNAYDDGVVRYRLAVANLQTLTGTF